MNGGDVGRGLRMRGDKAGLLAMPNEILDILYCTHDIEEES
jgi:hypothetical protein